MTASPPNASRSASDDEQQRYHRWLSQQGRADDNLDAMLRNLEKHHDYGLSQADDLLKQAKQAATPEEGKALANQSCDVRVEAYQSYIELIEISKNYDQYLQSYENSYSLEAYRAQHDTTPPPPSNDSLLRKALNSVANRLGSNPTQSVSKEPSEER